MAEASKGRGKLYVTTFTVEIVTRGAPLDGKDDLRLSDLAAMVYGDAESRWPVGVASAAVFKREHEEADGGMVANDESMGFLDGYANLGLDPNGDDLPESDDRPEHLRVFDEALAEGKSVTDAAVAALTTARKASEGNQYQTLVAVATSLSERLQQRRSEDKTAGILDGASRARLMEFVHPYDSIGQRNRERGFAFYPQPQHRYPE